MDTKIISYHPMIWNHLLRLLNSSDRTDPDIRQAREMYFGALHREMAPLHYYYGPDNPLFLISRLYRNWSPIDRTDTINTFNVDFSPIPDATMFRKTFETVCLETAEQFWKDHSSIVVLWSGGIDSTCAALALMETRPTDCTLRMLGTQNSIDEYPDFYNKHKHLIDIVDADDLLTVDRFNDDVQYVTGEIGDQLFGGGVTDHIEYKDLPWQDALRKMDDPFRLARFVELHPDREYERMSRMVWNRLWRLEKYCSLSPIPIKTWFDFSWWITFATKVNYCTYKQVKLVADRNDVVQPLNVNCYRPFFLTDDFQRWSITNHDLKMPGDDDSYKLPAKEFIVSRTNDVRYAVNKGKHISLREVYGDSWYDKWLRDRTTNYMLTSQGNVYNISRDFPQDKLLSLFSKSK